MTVRSRKPIQRRAHEQVGERERSEGCAHEDVAAVEEEQREAERQQRQEVARVPGEEAPHVDEPEEEDGAERDPGPPPVQHLAAERADPATGHAPSDLRPGQGPRDPAVSVLHRSLRDLTRGARPHLDRPAPCCLVEGDVGLRLGRVALEPVRDLRVGKEAREDLALPQPGRPGLGSERLLDRLRGSGRGHRPSAAVGGPRSRREQERERHGARPLLHLRKDQSLLPMKLSGVTRMIAAACATIFPTPAVTIR